MRGPALVRELGARLVQQQLGLQASVESLCAVLRDRAPTYFGPADVLVYEGLDALERAGTANATLLARSLQCFSAAHMQPAALLPVLERYRRAGYHAGLLALGQQHPELFDTVLAALGDLLAAPAPGAAAAFEAALAAPSDAFVARLLDWLFEQAVAASVLLDARGVSERHLRLLGAQALAADGLLRSRARADVWWKLLARLGRPVDAAGVLLRLAAAITQDATLEHLSLPLGDRLQYLAMAVATLRAAAQPTGPAEDQLEVGLVQMDLLHALGPAAPAALDLHSRLFDATSLFLQFSEPLDVPLCSLQLVRLAAHTDAVLVARLWQRLLTSDPAPAAVARRFKEASAKLASSPAAYPVPYLVDMLALLACKAAAGEPATGPAWFADLFPAPALPQVRRALAELAERRDGFWAHPDRRRFLGQLLAAVSSSASVGVAS